MSCNNEPWHSYILPKGDPKNIRITWQTPWVLLTLAFFHRKAANFTISENTDTETILVFYFFWYFFLESLTIFLINLVTILTISAKFATPGLLKTKIFRNKGYDVLNSDYDVTNKILSHDSNDIVHVVMWPKFAKSLLKFGISMREVIITSIL